MQCKICHSQNVKKILSSFNTHGRHIIDRKDNFSMFSCTECGVVFLGGIKIDDDYYKKYYTVNYYSDDGGNKFINRLWSQLYRFLFFKKEKYIRNYFKGNKKISILDIGCGGGEFLSGLNSDVFEKNGIEINRQAIEMCREKDINVYDKPVELIDFGEKKFDVITLWHVLEHIEKPLELFNKINQILQDNGILVFATPNTDSLGFKYGEKYWFHLDSPRHLVLYNPKSIQWLLEKSGFKIVGAKNEFYDFPLDLFWSVRKSWIKFFVYPLYPLFKFFSREHLTFICKKI